MTSLEVWNAALIWGTKLRYRRGARSPGHLGYPPEVGIVDRQRLHRQPAACLVLDPSAAPAVGQLVGGDPIQPGQRGPLAGPVALGSQQRRGEHLGRQIGRQFRIAGAAQEVAEHRRQMAAIESHERVGVSVDELGQQVVVVSGHHHHHPFLRSERSDCDNQPATAPTASGHRERETRGLPTARDRGLRQDNPRVQLM